MGWSSHGARVGSVLSSRLLDPTREFSQEVGALEEVFNQRARLGIMSCLMAAEELSFLELKEALGLTDGNLSSHLNTLEKRGFIEMKKGYRGRRPHTSVSPTTAGRRALTKYVSALGDLVSRITANEKQP